MRLLIFAVGAGSRWFRSTADRPLGASGCARPVSTIETLMRVAMLNVDLPTTGRGGVAYQVSRLANSMVGRGHEVVFFSFSPAPADARYEVRRIKFLSQRFSGTKLGHLVGAPVAFAARGYGGFDVLHAHGDSYLLVGQRTPVVRTYYGTAKEEARHAERRRRRWSQRILYLGERVSRRTSTLTVGISSNTAFALGGLDEVIPCGVDLDRFRPGKKSTRPSVLFVGTLDGRKRGEFVLRAFSEYIRPRIPEAELWFVGETDLDEPGVHALGKVSDEEIARLFREAWVFTLPSTYEGFGVPYIEAMASGTAVVATPNAGAAEVLQEDSGGLIAEDTAYASTLYEVLVNSELRGQLEARGRAHSTKFNWPEVARRYEDVYNLARKRMS